MHLKDLDSHIACLCRSDQCLLHVCRASSHVACWFECHDNLNSLVNHDRTYMFLAATKHNAYWSILCRHVASVSHVLHMSSVLFVFSCCDLFCVHVVFVKCIIRERRSEDAGGGTFVKTFVIDDTGGFLPRKSHRTVHKDALTWWQTNAIYGEVCVAEQPGQRLKAGEHPLAMLAEYSLVPP